MLNIKIIKFALSLTFFPDIDLLIWFPLTINKLEIALISVSIVLNVNDNASISIPITISGLLFLKPKIFVCNVDEKSIQNGNNYTKANIEKFGKENTLVVSADIENQINELETSEKKNYMEMIGLKKTGLDILIQKGYKILELDTYFTSGLEETRAWTIQKNCTAPKAAGEIHTDFEKGFIKAETISYEDFIENEGWVNSKVNGKMRLEGKDYIVKDGDVLNFRFNTWPNPFHTKIN